MEKRVNVHQEAYQFTCGLDVQLLVDHCLKANVKQVQLIMGEVEQVQVQLRTANVSSQNKSALHLRIILFVGWVVEVDVTDAFVWSDSVDTFDGVIDFVELFFVVEGKVEDGDHFEELFEWVEFFDKKSETFDHHLLGQDHHDFVFELFADDHVSNGSGDEFFVEFFLIFLSGEEFFEIVHFMS